MEYMVLQVLQAIFAEPTHNANVLKVKGRELRDINAEIANQARHRKKLQAIFAEPTISLVKVLKFTNRVSIHQVKICDKRLKELHAKRDETAIIVQYSRRFVSSFCDLALQICYKHQITAETLTTVLASLHMDDRAFAQKLMEIVWQESVQVHNNNADFDCLKITKTMTRLATWLMRTNSRYILYFQEENIIEKLHRAMQAMRDLERDMVLTGRAGATMAYEPLQSLIENARALVWRQQRR